MADEFLNDPHWVHRVTSFFNLLDFDKKGYIQQADWERWVDNIAKEINPDPHLIDRLRKTSEDYFGAIGIKKGTRLNCDEYVKAFSEFAVRERTKKKRGDIPFLYPWNDSVYDVADTNHDGFVSLEEYRKIFTACGLPESAADQAFVVVDVNGDGRIDRDELNNYEYKFWFTTGLHEAKGMFGDAFEIESSPM